MTAETVIDIAGGRQGGAARFLHEFDRYRADNPPIPLQVIGREHQLTPRWLLGREVASRGGRHKISINNASFVTGTSRTVLLRNALHFSSQEEFREIGFTPSPALRAQIPVIRALARRATRLVVPCTAMAERVTAFEPSLADKIAVRFHPVTVPASDGAEPTDTILLPIINSPYKQLDHHVRRLLSALKHSGSSTTRIVITDQATSFSDEVAGHGQVEFIGAMQHDELWRYWASARAIYYPTRVEAFGYPLAEARAAGVPIICQDSDQSREIAGPAAAVFREDDADSLKEAVGLAFQSRPRPDPGPFDRSDYFRWLLTDRSAR